MSCAGHRPNPVAEPAECFCSPLRQESVETSIVRSGLPTRTAVSTRAYRRSLEGKVPQRGSTMSQSNEQPAYLRIADDLRARIQAGDPPPGGMLDSDAVLVRTYGVARGTVRQAVAELELLGLVVSEMGKGRRVVGGAPGEPRSPSTRYETVAAALRQDMVSGKLSQGSPLPPELTLAEQHGVSKGTARQALQMLATEGRITAVHGKGWFVGTAQVALTRTDEVAESIRKAILAGDFPRESRIPGESALAEQYGVARVTVRRAIALLEAEGIIESRRGIGRIVVRSPR